jgi:hypothetical protein
MKKISSADTHHFLVQIVPLLFCFAFSSTVCNFNGKQKTAPNNDFILQQPAAAHPHSAAS